MLTSVVVTNKNYGRFLKQALDSILCQTACPNEIIVVDDASSDDSISVVKHYGDRVTLLETDGMGQAAALSAGLRRATGDVVFLLDADDYWHPAKVQRCLEFFNTHPECGYVHHPVVYVDGRGVPTRWPPLKKLAQGKVPVEVAFSLSVPFAPTSGICLRRSLLLQWGEIPEEIFRIRADYFLQTLAALTTTIGVVQDAVAFYRIHGNNGYSRNLTFNDLAKDRTMIMEFSRYLSFRYGVIVNPEQNFQYVRAYLADLRSRGDTREALRVFWGFARHALLQSPLSGKNFARVLFAMAFLANPAVGMQMFNKVTRLLRS